ncbi:hypothetical protein ASPZODRAFT_139933 [Penicilliopsis zonata CBS 506.65]|uniref:Oxidase ustYa n=1 Tax=Penicilliopsis zonata CBS 506.65 TaxID=1073090 RepID=A0A1L9SP00_9EURO|nr:hypothetical protein ASPZODRAFT_139933 [Penicilliopsis zonata CBS 506.65]OJJ48982.1 hypothetical protein ASPZODRAFT_139933 [Penicilliopsis zonata CBS 506.65]
MFKQKRIQYSPVHADEDESQSLPSKHQTSRIQTLEISILSAYALVLTVLYALTALRDKPSFLGQESGKSFIAVDNPSSHGLSGGFPIPGRDSEGYSLSLFHQLYCLALDSDPASSSPMHMHIHGNAHLNHCMDYLRQAIICAADTTLEKARAENGTLQQATDGWEVIHQCRDWDRVYASVRRAFDSEGINGYSFSK